MAGMYVHVLLSSWPHGEVAVKGLRFLRHQVGFSIPSFSQKIPEAAHNTSIHREHGGPNSRNRQCARNMLKVGIRGHREGISLHHQSKESLLKSL